MIEYVRKVQYKFKCQAFFYVKYIPSYHYENWQQPVKERAPNSLIRSDLQSCTNSMWGDESEAVAPIIWLYQIVDAQEEEVFFPDLLITLQSYVFIAFIWHNIWSRLQILR